MMRYHSVLKKKKRRRRNLKHIKWKMPISKDYILYDSSYMTCWERQSYGDLKNVNSFQGSEGRQRWTDRRQRIFKLTVYSEIISKLQNSYKNITKNFHMPYYTDPTNLYYFGISSLSLLFSELGLLNIPCYFIS